MVARKRPQQTKSSSTSPSAQLNHLIKEGKRAERAGNFPQATRAYEMAVDVLDTHCSPKKKGQHRALWRKLASLYVKTERLEAARSLYYSYLTDLHVGGNVSRLKRAILESFDVDGVDLEVNLVSIFQMPENHRFIHQLPQPIIERLFFQAVRSYEDNPETATYALIENLLPRTHIDLSATSDSISSLLAQPRKLLEALEDSNEDELDSLLVPAKLAQVVGDEQQQRLQQIWAERVHGTYMYRGAGYGVRTAILYMLDMLEGKDGIIRIEVEGIEDFDVYYNEQTILTSPTVLPARMYAQAKSRNEGQPAWSVSQLKAVLNSFAEVHCEDPTANFLFITDYHFGEQTTLTGILDYSNLWAFDQDHSIRKDVLDQLEHEITSHEGFEIAPFLKRIHFAVKARNLDDEIIERLAAFTGSPKAVAARYYEALFHKIHVLAEADKKGDDSKALSRTELERVLHEVVATVDVDALARPLHQGNLELITFSAAGIQSAQPDPNYYLGVSANMSHILTDQDIYRPELMDELVAKLVQRKFCILRSPSGTGKTTLMYRFAYENRQAFSIYRLRHLDEDSEAVATACERYIKSLLPSASMPVLLLIDDISRPEKRGWQKLVQPILELDNIYIIATTREDEWHDFLAAGINVEYVYPTLSADTARRTHKKLQDMRQLHSDYPDWQEAYEASKTDEVALFMEYTHILTQGRRIEEVLRQQIDHAAQLSPIRIDLLRVICTAHAFGGHVPADLLTDLVDTKGENLRDHLQYLVDEHMIIPDQENYIGLHELRSRFLLDLSHQYPPPTLTATFKNLIAHLPLSELAPIIEGVCRNFPEKARVIMDVLASRLNQEESLVEIAEIIRRLYIASEWHHAHKIKTHLDEFEVYTSEVNAFAAVLAPAFHKGDSFFNGLEKLIRENTLQAFQTATGRADSERFERQLASCMDVPGLAARVDKENNLASLVYFFNWMREVSPPLTMDVIETAALPHITELLHNETLGQQFASLLFHIWLNAPDYYEQLILQLGGRGVVTDKLKSMYPLIARIDWGRSDEEGEYVHLHFFAEEALPELEDKAKDVHEKAVFLAEIARRTFPTVSRVKITGRFNNGREYKAGMYDPATKNMPTDNFATSEDVEKNRIWLKAISNLYTNKTWYVYLQQQDTLRAQCISCLNMVVTLLNTVRKPGYSLPESQKQLTRQIYLIASMLDRASKMLLFPPDPEVSFLPSQEVQELYIDPIQLLHEHLLQGEYYLTSRTGGGLDQHFRNYIGVIERFVNFLGEYILKPNTRHLRLLKVNAATAKQNLEKFHQERVKIKLREHEHHELLPIEQRLITLLQQATQYIFDDDYRDSWEAAERAQQKIHLLASQLEKQLPRNNDEDITLIIALNSDLACTFPSLDVFSQLQESLLQWKGDQAQAYINELQSLSLLGCFAALAHQQYEDSWEAQLDRITVDLLARDVHVQFGPVLRPEDALDGAWGTLPILFQVSDLMDIDTKSAAIFEQIFGNTFNERQAFALIITDGQQIISPVIWTFGYWDRPKWDLACRLGSQEDFLKLCAIRTDLLEQYSKHLDVSVAKEPEYVQALLDVYNTTVDISLELAQLRYEVSIGRKGIEDVEKALKPDTEATSPEEKGNATRFEAQIEYLWEFQPASEFEAFHIDIINFFDDLFTQVRHEIELLKQMATGKADDGGEVLADQALESVVKLVENISSSRKEDEIQERLSRENEFDYEAMDVPDKFGLIYFIAKNYAHFSRTDY
ncbi:MAG: ATP-binding protein [Ardenticatenaceae bacterium]|nr:ATP-binding protein [Ardenticatenaceae bacterium]